MLYHRSQKVATVAMLAMVEKGWCSHLQLQTLVSPEVTVDLHTTNSERATTAARKAMRWTGYQQGQHRMLWESGGWEEAATNIKVSTLGGGGEVRARRATGTKMAAQLTTPRDRWTSTSLITPCSTEVALRAKDSRIQIIKGRKAMATSLETS